MVVVRRRGFPLLRGALVAGTGYAVGKRAANSASREASQSAAIADLQAQQTQQTPPAAPPPAATPPAGEDLTAKLEQLGRMAQQGLLSPEEFAAAKAKLLAG